MAKHFEWLAHFIGMNCPATNLKMQELLGCTPTHIGLLEDINKTIFKFALWENVKHKG